MRTRISDLIRDGIAIIEACDDPDCSAWLNQAKAELAVMSAKAQLRQALADVEGPVQPKAKVATAPSEAKSHAGIVSAFKRRGYDNVVLRDATDPSKPHNVRSYKLWLEQGRRVRKGEKGVMGLFHISQTEELPVNKPAANKSAKASKPAIQTTNPLGHPFPHAKLKNVKLTPIARLSKGGESLKPHLTA
jgi:hypothetical protein